MNKKVKSLSIVLPFSFILAGLTILCYLLDPAFEPDAYRVSSLVIVSNMVFFIIPTILFAVRQMKKNCEKITFAQGFRSGMYMGLWLGFGGIIVVCLLVSPVIGILWYVQTVKETKTAIKEKARRERKDEDAQQQ